MDQAGAPNLEVPAEPAAVDSRSKSSETPVTVVRDSERVQFRGLVVSPSEPVDLPAHPQTVEHQARRSLPALAGLHESAAISRPSDGEKDEQESAVYIPGFFSRKLSQYEDKSQEGSTPAAVHVLKGGAHGSQLPSSTEPSRSDVHGASLRTVSKEGSSVETALVAIKYDSPQPDWSQVSDLSTYANA